jgi:hypothetical protein
MITLSKESPVAAVSGTSLPWWKSCASKLGFANAAHEAADASAEQDSPKCAVTISVAADAERTPLTSMDPAVFRR